MKKLIKPLKADAHKYSHGTVCVVAGSRAYSGAAVLAVGGARRGGSGYIMYVAQDRLPALLVLRNYPDVVLRRRISEIHADAWVIGPGAPKLPRTLSLPKSSYVVLDAAAISRVDQIDARWKVLTPHMGELKFLGYESGDLQLDRVELASKIAKEQSAIVVLKGNQSVIAAPSGKVIVDKNGGAELATAGTGDILAGLIGSMLASWKPETEIEVVDVVAKALTMHGRAGKAASKLNAVVTATDLLSQLGVISS
jgi:hydroxyethylthiazole kinase-like uncharacterized protein yjeF